MGWLSLLFKNRVDGCREAMLISYAKHVRLAEHGDIPVTDSSPHFVGLYGELGSRYAARGEPVHEVAIWAELVPFLSMDERDAPTALAEYVVWKEYPKHARTAWLRGLIETSLESRMNDEAMPAMMTAAFVNSVAWISLLQPMIREKLQEMAECT